MFRPTTWQSKNNSRFLSSAVGGAGDDLFNQIVAMFAGGVDGFLVLPFMADSLYEDALGTIPASEAGPVHYIVDFSGNGRDIVVPEFQPLSAPTKSGNYIAFSGSNQRLFDPAEGIPFTPEQTLIFATDVLATENNDKLWYLRNDSFDAQIEVNTDLTYVIRTLSAGGGTTQYQDLAASKVSGVNIVALTTPLAGQANTARLNGVDGVAQLSNWSEGDGGPNVEFNIPMAQNLGAMMFIDRVLTLPEIQIVEDYFASKTGVTLP